MKYDISNLRSGKYLGEYEGESPYEAVRAMSRDAGYASDEAAMNAAGAATWADFMQALVVTEATVTDHDRERFESNLEDTNRSRW